MSFSNETILIGNGPSVLEHKFGQYIDTFGTVCRCNNFVIKKYEEHVGTKTDLFFRRPCNNVTEHDIKFKKTIICVTHRINSGQALVRSGLSMMKRLKKKGEVVMHSGKPVEKLSKQMNLDFHTESVSVGLIAIDYLLNVENVKPLYILGFDHLKKNGEKGIHYFPKKGSGVELHNGAKEAAFVNKLIEEGLIIRLENAISI